MNTLFRLVSLNAARVLFVGGLLIALYVGLSWALDVEDRPDAASIAATEAAREAAQSESEAAASAAAPTAEPTGAVGPTPTPVPATADPQELISAALPPAQTAVQVLDAGGGDALVDAVVTRLEEIGYDIVSIQESSRDVQRTTVYFTADNEAEAEALRARDPRFQDVEANRGLSEGVAIHVLVGPGF